MFLTEATAEQPIIYTRPVVYCIVPQDLAGRLLSLLDHWWARDPGVEVIAERRSANRRLDDLGAPDGSERRAGERRAVRTRGTVADEGWDLPWGARRHADRLQIVLFDVPVHGRDAIRVERALIGRVRGGDGAAADQLYSRHFARVHGWATHRVGRRHAEEATQAIFDAAFARVGDPELDERRFDRWLSEVAASVTD